MKTTPNMTENTKHLLALAGFARQVNALAATLPSWSGQSLDKQAPGWMSHKVYICDIETAYGDTRGEFKSWLLAAQREGLVRLCRADLVEAMDPAKVAASEICYLSATFNFVVL